MGRCREQATAVLPCTELCIIILLSGFSMGALGLPRLGEEALRTGGLRARRLSLMSTSNGRDVSYFPVENDADSAGILLFPGVKRSNFCSRSRQEPTLPVPPACPAAAGHRHTLLRTCPLPCGKGAPCPATAGQGERSQSKDGVQGAPGGHRQGEGQG